MLPQNIKHSINMYGRLSSTAVFAGTQLLQCPFGDVQQTANFNVVYSAAFGGGIEMAVEPSYRVGQAAGVGLQIYPSTFFD